MYQRVQVLPKDVKVVNPALPDYVARVIMHCLEKDPPIVTRVLKRFWRTWMPTQPYAHGRPFHFTNGADQSPVVEKWRLYVAGVESLS